MPVACETYYSVVADLLRNEARAPYQLHGLKSAFDLIFLDLLLGTMHIFHLIYKALEHVFLYVIQLALKTLAKGPIPRHVAFIMDGNRRYAKENDLSVASGYLAGAKVLTKIVDLCFDCGINTISLYAFSLENFHRPKEQVDILMKLLDGTLGEMGDNDPLVKKHDIRIRVLGRLELLEDNALRAIVKATNATKNNQGKVLNICIAYTSRDEITSAIRETVAASGFLGKITAKSLTENMFMGFPPLDIMIRTSGVYRLSDFMLWQCHQDTDIEVVGMNWPDFGRWDIGLILLRWQSRRRTLTDM
ncbi:uncharacterized protein N7479_006463 [Penicillium vulpinum]|uniref:uncharacterized protein n=1 Tax=Penicillium vulpinum TaxID=29845 RepID=UPI002546D534|nr:uncharacterized protein N7479_006463 [Penicillium vulpinum]KAJ5959313.1 hypothetical protein N7479_006463 [Penicillium vulpinum]